MRSAILSARWFRLFLSLVVLGAIFSSPVRVLSPVIGSVGHSTPAKRHYRQHVAPCKHPVGAPWGVRRVRFLGSLKDRGNEDRSEKLACTLALPIFLILPRGDRSSTPVRLDSFPCTRPLRC
jgi:hypothetical protein